VPDDTVINIVRERVGASPSGRFSPGWLSAHRAAGRTLATMLAQLGVKLDAVLSYDMPLNT